MEKLPSAPPLIVTEAELVPILSTDASNQPITAYHAVEETSSTRNIVENSPYDDSIERYLILVRKCLMTLGFIALLEFGLVVGVMSYIGLSGSLLLTVICAAMASSNGLFSLPDQHQGYIDYRNRGVILFVTGLIMCIVAAVLYKQYAGLQACAATLDYTTYRYYGDKDYFNSAKRCITKLYHTEVDAIGDCTCVTSKQHCLAFVDTVQCQPYLTNVPSLISGWYILSMAQMIVSLVFIVLYFFFIPPNSVPIAVIPPRPTPAVVLPTTTPQTITQSTSTSSTRNTSWNYPGGSSSFSNPQPSSFLMDRPVHHRHYEDLPVFIDFRDDSDCHHHSPHHHHSIFSSNHHQHHHHHNSGFHFFGSGHHDSGRHDDHHGSHYSSHHSHHDW